MYSIVLYCLPVKVIRTVLLAVRFSGGTSLSFFVFSDLNTDSTAHLAPETKATSSTITVINITNLSVSQVSFTFSSHSRQRWDCIKD
jgi:hypothetical protein